MLRQVALATLLGAVVGACSVGVSADIPDWRTDPTEPYPFSHVIPLLAATSLDGVYDRDPTENYPDRPSCVRCQPFPLDAGRSRLIFDRGRYRLEQVKPRYVAMGHYSVDGSRVTLFNDAECGSERGIYEWQLVDQRLTFIVVSDECAFGQRARDLTDEPWPAIGTAPS